MIWILFIGVLIDAYIFLLMVYLVGFFVQLLKIDFLFKLRQYKRRLEIDDIYRGVIKLAREKLTITIMILFPNTKI